MKRFLTNMRGLARYVLVRGLSSVITISIFALFARRLPQHDLENALSFSLVFGLFTAVGRTLPTFAARIRPDHSFEERQLAVLVGYKSVLQAQIVLAPILLLVALGITANPFVSLFATLILALAAFDFDLLRAAKGQDMVFPSLFLFGSIFALAYFGLHSSPTQRTAFIATLVQWIPVALYSGRLLLQTGMHRLRQVSVSAGRVFSAFLMVSFDGFILNLPMMPFIPTGADARIEVAILVRNFISSLFVLPFLMFLTNKVSLQEDDKRAQYKRWIFFASIFGSSVLAFFVYITYFGIISGTFLPPSSFLMIAPLTLGFAAYYSNARFLKSEGQASTRLALSMLLIAIVATATLYVARLGAAQTLLVQALSFFAMTAVILAIDFQNDRVSAQT